MVNIQFLFFFMWTCFICIQTVTRTMQCPQLSAYVAEEINSLRNEIASVDKVLLKLEQEIQQTTDVEG